METLSGRAGAEKSTSKSIKPEEGQGDGDWNEVKRKSRGKQSMNRNSKGTTGSDNSSNSSLGDRNGNENESVYYSLENSTSSETEKNDNDTNEANDNVDMSLDSLNNTFAEDDNQEDYDDGDEVLNASLIVNLSESRNLNFQSFLSAPSTPLNSSRSAPPDIHDEESNGKKSVTFSDDVTMQEIESENESDDPSQMNSSSVNVVDETFDSTRDLEDEEIRDESPAQPPGRPLMSYADVIRNNNTTHKENGIDEVMSTLEGKMNEHQINSNDVEDSDDEVIFVEEVKGTGVRNIPPPRKQRNKPKKDDDEIEIVYEGAGDGSFNSSMTIKKEPEELLRTYANVQKINLNAQTESIDAADVEVQRINEKVDDGLPTTVSILETSNGVKIYLIGTAHFSLQSQNDVKETINKVNPKIVFLELCHSRKNILNMDEEEILKQASNLGIASYKAAARNGGYLQAALHMILLSMSATLTKKLGMAPGGEFRVAAREANKCPGCIVVLGDRPFQTTLRRAFRSLTIFQKFKLLYHFLTTNDDITPEEVEKCKERDMIEAMLAEMTGEFPGITKVFVDERDAYLAHSLYMAATDQKGLTPVVAVVGMGHVAGMKKYFGSTSQEMISGLSSIPPVALSERVLITCVKLGFYGVLAFGAYRMVKYTGVDKNIITNASTLSSRFLGSFAAFKSSIARQ